VGGGTPGVELERRLVSDTLLGFVVGTGGGRELGGGKGAVAVAVAVEVDGVDPDPERVVAIFINLENRPPLIPFTSVSVEGVGKGSVDGAADRGRSLREEYMSCGAVIAVGGMGLGAVAIIGAGGFLGSETLPGAGTCGGGSGA